MDTKTWSKEDIEFYNKSREKQMLHYKRKESSIPVVREKKINKSLRIRDIRPKKYVAYIQRSRKKGILFDLSMGDFYHILSRDCEYCGGKSDCIDRVDSKRGYVLDNCVPACNKCNMMKYTHTTDDFLSHVKRVYEHNELNVRGV